MENNEINKITVAKFFYAILGGFIVNCLVAFAITLALSLKYQIFLYNKSGEINTNLAILIMTGLSAFLGGLFAGGVIRKKGWLFGTLTILIPFCLSLLIIWFFSIGKTLTEAGQIWFIRAMKNMLIFTLVQLPFSSIGGLLGEKIYKFDLTYEENECVDIYFKPHFRISIILPAVTLSIFLFTYYLDRSLLYIKWDIIGNYYFLIHPTLWLPEWIIFLFTFFSLTPFLTSLFALPLSTVFLLPKIWIKPRNSIINILFSLLLLSGIVVATFLANKIGYKLLKWNVSKISDKNVNIWPILLDKELAKLQKPIIEKLTKQKLIEELAKQKPIRELANYKDSVRVTPGEGAMGIKLGMSKEEVVSILGHPKQIDYPTDPKDGKIIEILNYPNLSVVLDKNNNVRFIALLLGHVTDLEVVGYDFLESDKYFTEQELNMLGKPDAIFRDLIYEKALALVLSEGAILESYTYVYENLGLALGLVFDRTMQKEGKKYYIAPYRIFIGKELSKVFK